MHLSVGNAGHLEGHQYNDGDQEHDHKDIHRLDHGGGTQNSKHANPEGAVIAIRLEHFGQDLVKRGAKAGFPAVITNVKDQGKGNDPDGKDDHIRLQRNKQLKKRAIGRRTLTATAS